MGLPTHLVNKRIQLSLNHACLLIENYTRSLACKSRAVCVSWLNYPT